MSVIFCVISSYFEEDYPHSSQISPWWHWCVYVILSLHKLSYYTQICSTSFPGLSWEWGYTLFWYDYCMRPCNTVRCWLLNACAYNSWQQGNMPLTADLRLTKNSCLINRCENSGRCFHCFRYMTRSTWQFCRCFGTSSGTEGPSLVQAFSSFFILFDTFRSTHSA